MKMINVEYPAEVHDTCMAYTSQYRSALRINGPAMTTTFILLCG